MVLTTVAVGAPAEVPVSPGLECEMTQYSALTQVLGTPQFLDKPSLAPMPAHGEGLMPKGIPTKKLCESEYGARAPADAGLEPNMQKAVIQLRLNLKT